MTAEDTIEEVSQRGTRLFARNKEEYVVVCIFPVVGVRYDSSTMWQVWIELWDESQKVLGHDELVGGIAYEGYNLKQVLKNILRCFDEYDEEKLLAAYG
jgi:hypothetical protein